MSDAIKHIVIVGGGSAGWLTAGLLAAELNFDQGKPLNQTIKITLIESPDVQTIGVGEGTWPSMRASLQKIGISETEFLQQCDASFKQGSSFHNWLHPNSHYLHPFSLPIGQPEFDICPIWLNHQQRSFAEAVSQQSAIYQFHLAPKQLNTPEYKFLNNYGYHLDAAKFTQLLQRHCSQRLQVNHLCQHIDHIECDNSGNIKSLVTQDKQSINADIFIDCSGQQGLLINKTLNVPFINQQHILFNDSALALQLPYNDNQDPVLSYTLSTAQNAGWIWDIGLPTRRGMGYVYSSQYCNDQQAAQTLLQYAQQINPTVAAKLQPRKLNFTPGYRQVCWQNNCIAIGMASGFIEPLEASALALVEWSANYLAKHFPRTKQEIPYQSSQMNAQFQRHWQQIIEFLKLHYVVSQRTEPYWQAHKLANSIPESLQQQLNHWQHTPPNSDDFVHKQALFPAASYQYILYGMQYPTKPAANKPSHIQQAQQLFTQNAQKQQQLIKVLPSNRALLSHIKQYGLSKI